MFLINNLMFLDGIASNILKVAGGIGVALIAVFLIYSLVKDAFSYVKGSGQVSIGKMVGKVLVLIICLGIATLAMATDGGLATVGKNFANFFLRLFNKGSSEMLDDAGLGTLGE